MKTWYSADIYKPLSKNVLFYDGPSVLNGEPILAIATAQNGNRKIGHMLQLWILPAISPIAAVRSGRDAAVCGNCRLRGDGHGTARVCYVEYWRSVENIWQARGKARRMTPLEFSAVTTGLQLRIGAYGDPTAVPMEAWRPLLQTAGGWTAYTHQWRTADAAYQFWCMASVDNLQEQREAQALGWRTFRMRHEGERLQANEILCPHEQNAEVHCAECALCRGNGRPAKQIAVTVHGNGVKWFGASRPTADAMAPRLVRR